jgi:peptidoglycan/xylan/chitin deacetylase (PgdA/CDA1 family)
MTATLCLSFDNLGEAAEIGVGALEPDAGRVGSHITATEILPRLLDRLDAHGLAATFFVEGLNAELYPDRLREVQARGHEVGYHAWAHEQWGDLDAGEQADNLARGIAAFAPLGIELAGLRPPGGGLGEGGTGVLRKAGLRYCSPAGEGGAIEDGVALLPFQWRHVDVTCTLPQLATVREQMTGSEDPLDPSGFQTFLEAEVARLRATSGFASIVLHPFMLAWLGGDCLEALLGLLGREARRGDLRVARFRDAAEQLLDEPGAFGGVSLDPTSWSG